MLIPDLKYTLVVAYDQKRVIGRDNALPWHLKKDLQHFREVTLGKPLLVGRKTYDAIGRPLPGRQMVVLSSQWGVSFKGCQVIHSLAELSLFCPPKSEVMVGGGQKIFEMLLPHAQKMLVTEVMAQVEGDTFFPEFDNDKWVEVKREVHRADRQNDYDFAFVEYIRR